MNAAPWYDLNWFDYTMLGLMALSVIISFFRGFVREAISVCVWVAGVLAAFKYAPLLEQHIHKITDWGMASYVLGFAVIFLSVWLVGLLFSLVIRSMTQGIGLGFADRLLGVCFGAVRGGLIVAMLLMFISMSPYQDKPAVTDSKIAFHLNSMIAMMDRHTPLDVQRLTHFAMTKTNMRGNR